MNFDKTQKKKQNISLSPNNLTADHTRKKIILRLVNYLIARVNTATC